MDKQWWAIAWPRTSTKARVSVQARRQRDDAPWSTSEILPASEGLRALTPLAASSALTSSIYQEQHALCKTRHVHAIRRSGRRVSCEQQDHIRSRCQASQLGLSSQKSISITSLQGTRTLLVKPISILRVCTHCILDHRSPLLQRPESQRG